MDRNDPTKSSAVPAERGLVEELNSGISRQRGQPRHRTYHGYYRRVGGDVGYPRPAQLIPLAENNLCGMQRIPSCQCLLSGPIDFLTVIVTGS